MKSDTPTKKIRLREAIWILRDHGYVNTEVVSLSGLERAGFSEVQANDIRSRKDFKNPNSDVYLMETPKGDSKVFSVPEIKKMALSLMTPTTTGIEESFREAVMARIQKIADENFLWDSQSQGLTEENFDDRVSCSFWNLALIIYQEAEQQE